MKCSKHTVLLSALPSTPFTEISSSLLLVLQSRNVSSIAGVAVPDPDCGHLVEIGLPRDKRDLKKGFISLDKADRLIMDGKGQKKKTGGNQALPRESPAGAGLVDGSTLAFRFRSGSEIEEVDENDDQREWIIELPRFEEEEK
jgi:hypothetical protein